MYHHLLILPMYELFPDLYCFLLHQDYDLSITAKGSWSRYFLHHVPHLLTTLWITVAHFILSTAAIKNRFDVIPFHCIKLSNYEISCNLEPPLSLAFSNYNIPEEVRIWPKLFYIFLL